MSTAALAECRAMIVCLVQCDCSLDSRVSSANDARSAAETVRLLGVLEASEAASGYKHGQTDWRSNRPTPQVCDGHLCNLPFRFHGCTTRGLCCRCTRFDKCHYFNALVALIFAHEALEMAINNALTTVCGTALQMMWLFV